MKHDQFEGQTAIVSGAGSGIGLATVKRFRERGARVVAIDYALEKCHALQEMDGSLLVIHADLSSEAGMQSIERLIIDEKVDASILVNVAGRLLVKPFMECDRTDWSDLL